MWHQRLSGCIVTFLFLSSSSSPSSSYDHQSFLCAFKDFKFLNCFPRFELFLNDVQNSKVEDLLHFVLLSYYSLLFNNLRSFLSSYHQTQAKGWKQKTRSKLRAFSVGWSFFIARARSFWRQNIKGTVQKSPRLLLMRPRKTALKQISSFSKITLLPKNHFNVPVHSFILRAHST